MKKGISIMIICILLSTVLISCSASNTAGEAAKRRIEAKKINPDGLPIRDNLMTPEEFEAAYNNDAQAHQKNVNDATVLEGYNAFYAGMTECQPFAEAMKIAKKEYDTTGTISDSTAQTAFDQFSLCGDVDPKVRQVVEQLNQQQTKNAVETVNTVLDAVSCAGGNVLGCVSLVLDIAQYFKANS